MVDKFNAPDNAELFYKCSQCGNMFEPENKVKTNCPVCGNSCSKDSCKFVHSSNEGY